MHGKRGKKKFQTWRKYINNIKWVNLIPSVLFKFHTNFKKYTTQAKIPMKPKSQNTIQNTKNDHDNQQKITWVRKNHGPNA
jgi:hypothetical protein